MPVDMMARCHSTFATLAKQFATREVTYRGIRNGEWDSLVVRAMVGSSQDTPINSVGSEPATTDTGTQNPLQVDRDYTVFDDMIASAMWPPVNGDFIDDANDASGIIKRYQVRAIPGQPTWRPLRGSQYTMARVHTKFYGDLITYWADDFTDTNGTSLASHTPASGTGGYSIAAGSISINTNRIVAGANPSYAYFAAGTARTKTTRANLCMNVSAGSLNAKFAEMGVAVRCESSGSGQREGYYITLKVGYTGANQTTKELRMVRRRDGSNTTIEAKTLTENIDLTATYQLRVRTAERSVEGRLFDADGNEVGGGLVSVDATLLASNTNQGVVFSHTLTDPSGPWLDALTVGGT